jgi:SAM-dependent methyltransferase
MNLRNTLKNVFIPKKDITYQYFCPACEQKIPEFKRFPNYYIDKLHQHRYIHSIFCLETMNLRQNICPNCGIGDSNRMYLLYLKQKLTQLNKTKQYTFLDIAPVESVARHIKSFPNVSYRSADLSDPKADDKVNVQNMSLYPDNHFDMLLCSHVLEHVDKDSQAMKELYRVLNPKGWGIVMVPIHLELTKDYENPKITTEAGRWKHFGQGDHVRLYSKQGFVSKLVRAGFKVKQYGIRYFGKEVFKVHGIHPDSVLYVVFK